jgi:tetratricopeptide (TPR) repeat protein
MNAAFNARGAGGVLAACLAAASLGFLPTTLAAQEDEYENALGRAKEREELLLELNQLAEAGEHAAVLARLQPILGEALDPRFGNLHGVCLAALGRHREAVPVYEAALRQDLQRAELHRNLAISLRELGVTGRAFAEFEDAVRLDPEDPETRLALGESLLHFGRLDRAAEELARAARGLPRDLRVALALARLAEAQGDVGKERRAWAKVDSLEGGAEAARALARLAGTDAERLLWYRRCAERSAAASDCRARLGELLLAGGDFAAAAEELRRAVDAGAGDAALHNLYLSLQLGADADGIEELVGSSPPPTAGSWGAVALARRGAGRTASALAAVLEGRGLDPEDLTLANLEAVLRMEMGQQDAARAIWRWILERDPEHPEARGNLGLE